MSEGIIIKSDGNKTIEQLRAEVAAFEANPIAPNAPEVSTPSAVNAPAPVTPTEKPVLPTPETTPPAEGKPKATQEPQETTEKASSETPKAAEPVKETDWKAAYQGLQRQYNKAFVEKKAESAPKVEVQPEPVPTTQPTVPVYMTPEFEQKIAADIEKHGVKALVSLTQFMINEQLSPIKSKFEATEAQQIEAQRLAGLERLVGEGHEWLKTPDGLQKMSAVLNDNPELWKTRDPYRAALGFISDIPSKAGQRGPAQSTGLTPILGASGAVPPVVSTPALSKLEKLESLQKEITTLQSRGQMAEAREKLKEMDKIDRGW